MTPELTAAAIESLRDIAKARIATWANPEYSEECDQLTTFVSMCAAALDGEAWAIDRVTATIAAIRDSLTAVPFPSESLTESVQLLAIRATGTRNILVEG